MAIDPSIYGQIQAPQPQNLLAQYGQVQALQGIQSQNRLAELSYGEKEREINADKVIARLLSEGKDVSTGLASQGYGKQSIAYTKAMQDAQEQKGKISKQNIDAVDAKLKQSRSLLDGVNTPEQYLRWHEANHSDSVLGPVLAARGVTSQQSLDAINTALATPGGFEKMLNQSRLGIEKFTEFNKPTIGSQNLGGSVQQTQTPGMGGAPVVTGSFNTTQSADNVATNDRLRRNAALSRDQSEDHFNRSQLKPFEATLPDGTPVLVRTDRQGNITPVAGYGPKDGSVKPLNEGQSKALLFGSRMESANEIIDSLSKSGTSISLPGSRSGFGAGSAINAASSPSQQQLSQAKRDFINAVLRRESGAAIAPSEFDNAEKQYFPQIGESKEVIEQKSNNRAIAIRGVKAEVPKAHQGSFREVQGSPTRSPPSNIDSLLNKYK